MKCGVQGCDCEIGAPKRFGSDALTRRQADRPLAGRFSPYPF